jgi:hypothetical protein
MLTRGLLNQADSLFGSPTMRGPETLTAPYPCLRQGLCDKQFAVPFSSGSQSGSIITNRAFRRQAGSKWLKKSDEDSIVRTTSKLVMAR